MASQEIITAKCDWSNYDKIMILACTYYNTTDRRYLVYVDNVGGNSSYGLFINCSGNATRSITFKDGLIEFYATIPNNYCSYNIPLKIWGLNTGEVDMYAYP